MAAVMTPSTTSTMPALLAVAELGETWRWPADVPTTALPRRPGERHWMPSLPQARSCHASM
jgi:hypothetical protein